MRKRPVIALATLLIGTGAGYAQPAPSSQYVTREEYDKLKAELDEVKKEMAEDKKNPPLRQEDVDKVVDEIEKDIANNHDAIGGLTLGTTNFVLTGYAHAEYSTGLHGNNSFGAGLNPIILWQLNDRLSIESELEIVLPQGTPEDPGDSLSEGEFNLEFASINYLVTNNLTIGAGKFLTPFGIFPQHLHPAWINKLPDHPLIYNEDTGLAPFQQVGAYITGGIPIGENSKIKYDVYLSNGPTLRNSADSAGDAGELGTIDASNNGDLNTNKAVGARIGFLPFPELELDYSILNGSIHPGGSPRVRALLQAASVHYKQTIDPLHGQVDFLGEYVWWNVGKHTYDVAGDLGGPYMFSDNRQGGYLQLAYRPTLVENKFLKNLEGVARVGFIDEPADAPDRPDRQRYTFGLDYWINPSTVLKAAYEFERGNDFKDNIFTLQAAVGF